jgi:outer membrane lipoprotein-sorting protein
MTPVWRRWLPAAVVPAVIAGGAVLGTVQAGAATDLPDKTPQEVLEMVADSSVRSLSGTVEQRSELGLPQLTTDSPSGESDASSGVPSGVASALELLGGSHTARVYLDGHSQARVQVMDRLAERDVIRNGRDVWFYSSKQNAAAHLILPEASESEGHHGDKAWTPEDLAEHFLSSVEPSTEVTVGSDSEVAGRSAYELVLTPDSSETLVGSVSIAVDSETGLPLSVDVQARGQDAPAFEVGFTELSLEAPSDDLFNFTPPPGATVTERVVEDHHAKHAKGDRGKHGKEYTKYGSGWETVIGLPADEVPAELMDSPVIAETAQEVDGGRLLSSVLVNVLVTDDGRVFAGSVPLEQLQAAAEGR